MVILNNDPDTLDYGSLTSVGPKFQFCSTFTVVSQGKGPLTTRKSDIVSSQ